MRARLAAPHGGRGRGGELSRSLSPTAKTAITQTDGASVFRFSSQRKLSHPIRRRARKIESAPQRGHKRPTAVPRLPPLCVCVKLGTIGHAAYNQFHNKSRTASSLARRANICQNVSVCRVVPGRERDTAEGSSKLTNERMSGAVAAASASWPREAGVASIPRFGRLLLSNGRGNANANRIRVQYNTQ